MIIGILSAPGFNYSTSITPQPLPNEFDFINHFIPCDKDPEGAREYIRQCLN